MHSPALGGSFMALTEKSAGGKNECSLTIKYEVLVKNK
jgi:hypothetical protein